jgi:hypothetical protein
VEQQGVLCWSPFTGAQVGIEIVGISLTALSGISGTKELGNAIPVPGTDDFDEVQEEFVFRLSEFDLDDAWRRSIWGAWTRQTLKQSSVSQLERTGRQSHSQRIGWVSIVSPQKTAERGYLWREEVLRQYKLVCGGKCRYMKSKSEHTLEYWDISPIFKW